MTQNEVGDVFLIKTLDVEAGIGSLLSQFDLNDYYKKVVAVKANFNSADPFPASTHLNTLEVLVKRLKEAGISDLILADRSGFLYGLTRRVLKKKGVFELSEKLGFKVKSVF